MENTTDFFAHTLSFQKKKKQTREQKQNTKDSLPSFPSKKQLFSFLDTSKKRTIKKRNRVYKKNQKMRVKQNEKPFFKRQKNKTWKNTEV